MTRPPAFPKLTVVTVTYQSAHLTVKLAKTLMQFQNVCIVDNASQDGTVDLLRSLLPHAKFITNKVNAGFGAANNMGVDQATTEQVLLLNPDCDIDVLSVDILMRTMQRNPAAGLIAPQAWLPNGKAQMSYKEAFFEVSSKLPYIVPEAVCSTKWLSGCCILARKSAYSQIGGFDENFFLYYEDDDLCLRMHLASWECLLEPAADAMHVGGGGSAPGWRIELFKHYHYALSRRRMIGKYQGYVAAWFYRIKTMTAFLPACLIYSLLLRRKYILKWLGWGWSCLKPIKYLPHRSAR
jgi:N-acetylglucosaminyl-diphospho-decaprenol L-rhamnosyltransferase